MRGRMLGLLHTPFYENLSCLIIGRSKLLERRGGSSGSDTSSSVQIVGQSLANRTVDGRHMVVPPFSKEEGSPAWTEESVLTGK
jgi:hypothetical protein